MTVRSQCVEVNNSYDEYKTVDTGVPQGSVLGPWNELPSRNIESHVAEEINDSGWFSGIFAEDIKNRIS
ncbi:hypothetical protein J437_LFUL006105 [Ladona fulva]|uniref:Reverse transcriptase n=1 Tax=Ladona fulva TaxID=123851 RepID=A0A8K0KD18_LADFU|nr:hypothetical protein J437_LFUL006105 [Ladona fulva]